MCIFGNITNVEENVFDCKLDGETIRIQYRVRNTIPDKVYHPERLNPHIYPYVLAESDRRTDVLAKKIKTATENRFKKLYPNHLD